MSCHLCKTTEDIFKLQRCSHKLCRECLYKYIKENFSCKIKCPISSCHTILSDPDIRKFLSIGDEERYEKLGLTSIFRKCLSKYCTYIYSCTDINLCFTCPECEQPNCVRCNARHVPSECRSNNQTSETEKDAAAKLVLQNKRLDVIHNFDNKNNLIPAHEGFECPNCCKFILPKEGVMLRCGCNHCMSCFENHCKEQKHFNQLKCYNCDKELAEVEKTEIMGSDKIRKLSDRAIKKQLWHCKYIDCDQTWYTDKTSGFMICPKCEKRNCISCDNEHDGMTCEDFRKTKGYKNLYASINKAKNMAKVKCYKCNELLIQGDGCNALPCPDCNVYTCLYKGIKAGVGGCECTSIKPCDIRCIYGCNPE